MSKRRISSRRTASMTGVGPRRFRVAPVAAALVCALIADAGWQAAAQRVPSEEVPGTERGLFGRRTTSRATSAQLMVRIDQLESQLRTLTGNIEQYEFRIRQLEETLRRFQEDAEFRFQELGAKRSDAKRSNTGRRSESRTSPSPFPAPLLSDRPSSRPSRPENFGGTKPLALPAPNYPAAAAPLNINPAARPAAAGPVSPGPVSLGPFSSSPFSPDVGNPADVALGVPDDPQTSYEVAYAFILQRDFQAAEGAFGDFLRRYPKDKLTPDAQYWLGESHFAQGRFRDAADAFLKGYKRFKSSNKGPPSLVKLAMSLHALGQKEAACASYAEFGRQFPKASAALRDRVRAERKSARC